jgi:hypothetical protein
MKRRHSHKNELAWKAEEVRYYVVLSDVMSGEVLRTKKGEYATWLDVTVSSEFVGDLDEYASELGDEFYLEVQESDLPYLEKPEGDWEFRKVEIGEEFLNTILECGNYTHHRISERCHFHTNFYSFLSGYRWCKPRKEGFEKWWDEEGKHMKNGMIDKRGLAKLAWENGAYKARESK